MPRIAPCIWLDDQAEPAAAFYAATFPAGRVTATSRYPESLDNPSGKPRGSVLTVELELANQCFTLLNGGPNFRPNPSISFFVQVESVRESDRLFAALAEGGQVMMPIDAYPWSERYGWVQDRFGVSWQVMAGGRSGGGPRITPCLMFAGPQLGRAEEPCAATPASSPTGESSAWSATAPPRGPKGRSSTGASCSTGRRWSQWIAA